MPLDLYADRPKPARTSDRFHGIASWWPAWVLGIGCAVITIGYLLSIAGPSPSPAPDDDKPVPVVVSGLHVMIVEETGERDKLPAGQIAIFSSADLIDWYAANCAKEDGATAYRNFDQHDKLDQENKVWQELRASLTLPPPAVVLSNGKRTIQTALPPNPEAMKAVLEKFKNGK